MKGFSFDFEPVDIVHWMMHLTFDGENFTTLPNAPETFCFQEDRGGKLVAMDTPTVLSAETLKAQLFHWGASASRNGRGISNRVLGPLEDFLSHQTSAPGQMWLLYQPDTRVIQAIACMGENIVKFGSAHYIELKSFLVNPSGQCRGLGIGSAFFQELYDCHQDHATEGLLHVAGFCLASLPSVSKFWEKQGFSIAKTFATTGTVMMTQCFSK